MSVYQVNLVGRRALREPEFCERLRSEPEAALAEQGLEPDELEALLGGDVARLYAMGAHEYLLMGLARREVLGLDLTTFSERIRRAEPRLDY